MSVGTYVKVSGVWKRVTRLYGKVSGTWREAIAGYSKASGSWRLTHSAYAASSYFTRGVGSGSQTVPAEANAVHVQYAVGGGGGGLHSVGYDKAGGESSGPGGGSGAYVSDKIFLVNGGETLSWIVGSGGTRNGALYSGNSGSSGGATSLTGSSTGQIFNLNGGGRAVITSSGGVQGPLRQDAAGGGGSVSHIDSSITSGSFLDSSYNLEVISSGNSELQGGPRGTFNTSGNGATGQRLGNCSGDNCQIQGGAGADSYAGAVAGGAGGNKGFSNPGTADMTGRPGTRGSGGGGGATVESAPGGNGGSGELRYRFLNVF